MKKNYVSILLALGLTSVAFGSTTTGTNKATASLAASCQISAQMYHLEIMFQQLNQIQVKILQYYVQEG